MGTFIDLKGQHFGRLTVLQRAPDHRNYPGAQWLCECSCGNQKVIYGQPLRKGTTKSCGCWQKDNPSNLRHGYGRAGPRDSEYNAWVNMRARCNNPNTPQYADYGGRGITVDPAWDNFGQFLVDMGPKPTALHSLERVDNDEGYGPDNCCWASKEVQMSNRRDLGARRLQRLPDYLEDCVSFLEDHVGGISLALRDRLKRLV